MMEGAELEAEFQRVVKLVQDLPPDGPYQPSNGERLKFYCLYKQATEGPCNTDRPGFLDFVGKSKWDSWNNLGDMTKEEAKRKYIQGFQKMQGKIKELGLG